MSKFRFQLDTFLYVAAAECLYWQAVTVITWQVVIGGFGVLFVSWKTKRSAGVAQKVEVNSQP